MFDEIGEKLKKVAGVLFTISFITITLLTIRNISLISIIEENRAILIWTQIIYCVLGIFLSFLGACLLYAFGTITNTCIDISNHIQKSDSNKFTFIPSDSADCGATREEEKGETGINEYDGYKFNPKAIDSGNDTLDEWIKKTKDNFK